MLHTVFKFCVNAHNPGEIFPVARIKVLKLGIKALVTRIKALKLGIKVPVTRIKVLKLGALILATRIKALKLGTIILALEYAIARQLAKGIICCITEI